MGGPGFSGFLSLKGLGLVDVRCGRAFARTSRALAQDPCSLRKQR